MKTTVFRVGDNLYFSDFQYVKVPSIHNMLPGIHAFRILGVLGFSLEFPEYFVFDPGIYRI
jgi:hypothetical protein